MNIYLKWYGISKPELIARYALTDDFLRELPINMGTFNALVASGIYTREQLLAKSEAELFKLPGIGHGGVNQIKRWIGVRAQGARLSDPVAKIRSRLARCIEALVLTGRLSIYDASRLLAALDAEPGSDGVGGSESLAPARP
jgi:hypothetical protein